MPDFSAAAEELRHLAYCFDRNQPGRDVERYVVEKADLIARLFKVATLIEERKPVGHEKATPAPKGVKGWSPGYVSVDGSIVRVEVRKKRAG